MCYRPHPTSAREVTGEPPGQLDWMAKKFLDFLAMQQHQVPMWKILSRARVGTKDMAVC